MAFTLGSHIILACFGVGLPVLMLFAEWRFLRTRDEGWRTLARRWSKAFAFFLEAIFVGIYLYAWDRLSPRAHWRTGFPIALSGFATVLLLPSLVYLFVLFKGKRPKAGKGLAD